MNVQQEVQGLEAVRKLEQELEPKAGVSLDPQVLCQKYRAIRATLVAALGFLQHFPFIGKGVVAAIGFLMDLADTLCPAPTPPPTPTPIP